MSTSTYGLDGITLLKLEKSVTSNVLTILPSPGGNDKIKIGTGPKLI